MTLTEAINLFKAYRESKQYLQYQTFVESLSRSENENVIIPITEGINVIIEGAFIRNYANSAFKKYLTIPNKEVLAELIKNKNYDEIRNYMFGAMIRAVDSEYPNQNQESSAEGLYTKAIEYLSEKPDLVEKYDPNYSIVTYVYNFIMRPAKHIFNLSSGRRLEQANIHNEAKVSYNSENEDKIKEDQSNKFGKIIDDNIVAGKIEVRWEGSKGKNGQYIVKPYTEMVPVDELDINDVKSGLDTISSDTKIDNGGNENLTLGDTASFADKSHDQEKTGNAIQDDIEEAIKEVIEDAQDNPKLFSSEDIKQIKPLIERQLDAQTSAESYHDLKEKKRQQESNIKYRKHADRYQVQIDKLDAAMKKLEPIVANSYGKKTFGIDFNLSRKQAEWIWKQFIELMKTTPSVNKWFAENKGIGKGVNPENVVKTPEGNFVMSEKEIRARQHQAAVEKLKEKKRLAKEAEENNNQ